MSLIIVCLSSEIGDEWWPFVVHQKGISHTLQWNSLWSSFMSYSISEQESGLFDPANVSKTFTCLKCNRRSSKGSTLTGSSSLEQLGNSSAITQSALQGEPLSSSCSVQNETPFWVSLKKKDRRVISTKKKQARAHNCKTAHPQPSVPQKYRLWKRRVKSVLQTCRAGRYADTQNLQEKQQKTWLLNDNLLPLGNGATTVTLKGQLEMLQLCSVE